MKIVAAVFADFEQNFLGGPSHLRTPLGTRPALQHALTRLMQVTGLDGRCLFVRPRDRDAAEETLRGLGLQDRIDLLALDDGARPRRGLVRSARKWNLASWRGGPLGLSWFDEYIEPLCVARVLDHYGCEGVLCLDGHQAALDAPIASAMLAYQREHEDEARLVFTQAPPGLAGILLRRQATRELLEQQIPAGILLAYRPETPNADPITRPPCLHVPPEISRTTGRFLADTRRARELLAEAFTQLGEEADAAALCEWSRRDRRALAGPLPVEIELELTTDDPLPETTLRPRGRRVPRRRLENLDALDRLAREFAAYDDRLLFLAGHGDPLLHPRFPDICRRIRAAGVCGLGVATPLVELSDAALETLFERQVDVLEVQLDAHSAATYGQVHGADYFERVLSHIQRIEQLRRDRVSPQPLIVCSLIRCAATLGEMEAFFDYWIRATGSAVIHGYNTYGERLPPDSLLSLQPPIREACRRLDSRLVFLADGRVPFCNQDVGNETVLGNWFSESVTDIWNGSLFSVLRNAHDRLALTGLSLCQRCTEWFRP